MDKWEYNTIDQRNYIRNLDNLKLPILSEDSIDEILNSFGKDGWELVGWFGIWFIFKRKMEG